MAKEKFREELVHGVDRLISELSIPGENITRIDFGDNTFSWGIALASSEEVQPLTERILHLEL